MASSQELAQLFEQYRQWISQLNQQNKELIERIGALGFNLSILENENKQLRSEIAAERAEREAAAKQMREATLRIEALEQNVRNLMSVSTSVMDLLGVPRSS